MVLVEIAITSFKYSDINFRLVPQNVLKPSGVGSKPFSPRENRGPIIHRFLNAT